MKKLNNKGFTLVELLAVIVILITIMSIAIPTISSSLERSKEKQNKAKIKNIEAAAELYVTDNKNEIFNTLSSLTSGDEEGKECKINLDQLVDYLDEEDLKDADGEELSGVILYDGSSIEYSEEDSDSGENSKLDDCVSG